MKTNITDDVRQRLTEIHEQLDRVLETLGDLNGELQEIADDQAEEVEATATSMTSGQYQDAAAIAQELTEANNYIGDAIDLIADKCSPILFKHTTAHLPGFAEPKERLEHLRSQLRAECISYAELAELQGLKEYIDPGDVELLEAAGVPDVQQ